MLMRMMMERGKGRDGMEGGRGRRRREFNHHFRRPSSVVMDEGEGELAPPEPRLPLVLSSRTDGWMALGRASGCDSILFSKWLDSQAFKRVEKDVKDLWRHHGLHSLPQSLKGFFAMTLTRLHCE